MIERDEGFKGAAVADLGAQVTQLFYYESTNTEA